MRMFQLQCEDSLSSFNARRNLVQVCNRSIVFKCVTVQSCLSVQPFNLIQVCNRPIICDGRTNQKSSVRPAQAVTSL